MSHILLILAIGAGIPGTDAPAWSLEHSVFRASDSTVRVELSYDIPYTLLTFQRESTGYVARFSVQIQCWDEQRKLVRSQDWDERIFEASYDATMKLNARATGRESAIAPRTRLSAQAVIQDLQSDRIQTWTFKIEPPQNLSEMRLSRARQTGNSATDTLYVVLETYARENEESLAAATNGEPETVAVAVMQEKRIRAKARQAIVPDSWRAVHSFVFPLVGLENGHYDVKADIIDREGRILESRRAGFEIGNSVFGSEHDFQERVNQLLWIATESEMQKLRTAAPPQRESLWNAFWKTRDQTPTTEENEAERTYFERIDYAEKHFGHGDRGYRSDRARVYVKYGPPDNVESRPFEGDSNAYEKWYYYNLSLTFLFYDVSGFGEFKQIEPKP